MCEGHATLATLSFQDFLHARSSRIERGRHLLREVFPHEEAGRRRHGRSVPGQAARPGWLPEDAGGEEGSLPPHREQGVRGSVPRRSAARRPDEPPQHRAGLRARPGKRRLFHRHGVRAGQIAARPDRHHDAAEGEDSRRALSQPGGADLRRSFLRAQSDRHGRQIAQPGASRPEPAERPHLLRRGREDHRLRSRPKQG